MLSHADNAFLTQAGKGTPMGELLRRFWMPALLSEELPERDGAPKKIRIMGEDLLAFRQTDGRIGIVEPHCLHRGANLYYGRNEECGLRCSFHGWKFDIDGNCIDLPTSPPESAYKDTIKLLAYPTREWGEMIWVYMGPRELMPELPQLEMALVPASSRFVTKKWQDCNWVQSLEGAIDTSHFSFLHKVLATDEDAARKAMANAALGDQSKPDDRVRWVQNDPRPRFQVLGHETGLVIGGGRKTDSRDLYWRIAQFLMPNHAYTPAAFPADATQSAAFKNDLCARLSVDAADMRDQVAPLALDSAAAFRGVIGSMAEQYEKVALASTGEDESRYAQHTLGDMRANLSGGADIYAAFTPWLVSLEGGEAVDGDIQAGFARVEAGYAAIAGDAIPEVPPDWNADAPSEADLATPYGQLFTLLSVEADPTIDGSLVARMTAAADLLGIPQLPE